MRLAKYGHACVRLERNATVLVIDPGMWSEPEAVEGADAVLVTHAHADHVNVDMLRTACQANPALHIWTVDGAAKELDLGDAVTTVSAGDRFTAAGFEVTVHGGEHAITHPDYPQVANVGFFVDGAVYHPGDALIGPGTAVDTLLVPASAPWLKLAEAIDFVRAVRPGRAHPIHDALLSDKGQLTVDGWFERAGRTTYQRLAPGESVTL